MFIFFMLWQGIKPPTEPTHQPTAQSATAFWTDTYNFFLSPLTFFYIICFFHLFLSPCLALSQSPRRLGLYLIFLCIPVESHKLYASHKAKCPSIHFYFTKHIKLEFHMWIISVEMVKTVKYLIAIRKQVSIAACSLRVFRRRETKVCPAETDLRYGNIK